MGERETERERERERAGASPSAKTKMKFGLAGAGAAVVARNSAAVSSAETIAPGLDSLALDCVASAHAAGRRGRSELARDLPRGASHSKTPDCDSDPSLVVKCVPREVTM